MAVKFDHFHTHNIIIIKYVPIFVVNSCRAVARGGAEGDFTDCSNFHLGVFDDSTFSGTLAYEISFMLCINLIAIVVCLNN